LGATSSPSPPSTVPPGAHRPSAPPPRVTLTPFAPGARQPIEASPSPPSPLSPAPPHERFGLEEEPEDETAVPSPRVVARGTDAPLRGVSPEPAPPPTLGPEPGIAPRAEEAQPVEPKRSESPPVSPPRPELGRLAARSEAVTRPEALRPHPPAHELPQRLEAHRSEPPKKEGTPAQAGVGSVAPAIASPVTHHLVIEPAPLDPAALGPIAALLEDPSVHHILVQGAMGICFERRGAGLISSTARFLTQPALLRAAASLFAQAGLAIGADPIQEAVLPDGTHVTLVLPPVAEWGVSLEIRKLGQALVSAEALMAQGMLSPEMWAFLQSAMAHRRNIAVIGPAQANASALLGAMLLACREERVLILEEASEIPLAPNPKHNRFKAGPMGMSTLIRRLGHLRADWFVIDGLSSGALRDALVLAGSRGGGTLLGIHAAFHPAVVDEIVALASLGSSREGLRELVFQAIHVLVQLDRVHGVGRVVSIGELAEGQLVERFRPRNGEGTFFVQGEGRSTTIIP
ncbi:MAG: ATPase, T2SS/T4P/T4SS family, partial [Sandaracinaceae bacterium]|nr:ATPase, T2SS/T4P/T4SS family [Sandaracinaceae bacterium]